MEKNVTFVKVTTERGNKKNLKSWKIMQRNIFGRKRNDIVLIRK